MSDESEVKMLAVQCGQNCDCSPDECREIENRLTTALTDPLPTFVPNDFQRNVTVLSNALENMSFALGILARLTEEAFLMGDDDQVEA